MDDEGTASSTLRPRRRAGWWIAGGAVSLLAVGLWLGRMPIADSFLHDQFADRGIAARYTIEKIGFRTQRLTNIVIGDPAHPDLTARALEVSIGYGLTGPYVAAVRGDGLRLYGRLVDGRLSLGALDKFRNPDDKTPFALPDMAAALRDARARIETPWGAIGASLNGSGNLRRDFRGELALVAPRLALADCTARHSTFYGTVTVRGARPRIVGPLRGERTDCGGKVPAVVTAPQIALDLSLSEDLRQWDGRVDAMIAGIASKAVTADKLAIKAHVTGNIDSSRVDIDARAARAQGGGFVITDLALAGRGLVGSADPQLEGSIRIARAHAGDALRRSIVNRGQGLDRSPLGPIATRASAALARMLSDASARTDFSLTGQGQSLRLEIVAPELRGASGAHVIGSPDSRIGYLFAAANPAVIATGRWTFGGGDLPSGSLALDRAVDGSIDGTARFDEYAAQGARLALAPVRFSGNPQNALRFATVATLTGPLTDGRVEGLRIPLSGHLMPDAGIRLDGGCTGIAVRHIAAGGFRVQAGGVQLCSAPGAPLLTAGPGGLRGVVQLPGLHLRGTSGTAPFAFDARRGDIDLATWRWALAAADMRLGEGDGATRFAASRLAGRADGDGLSGTLSGASGKIGAVPLRMGEIDGKWRWTNGILSLNGGLVLTDAEPDARFAPLVSDNAAVRLADGEIEATAAFRERKSGAAIVDTVIRHRLGAGTGAADLFVRDLRFGETFQPDQLSRLALGIIANVKGVVTGRGRIEWNDSGVTSNGSFTAADSDLAAAFGPVTGLNATLTFDDLIGLHSAPAQKVALTEVNPGIPILDGMLEYQLLGDNRVRIEGGRWPFAGGELVLHPTTIDFNADKPRRLIFDLVGVNAAIFLQQFGFENINASGLFDGSLPVEFDGLGGRIVGGRIDARGPGMLAYVGELSNHNLGAMANFAFSALRSLKYDDLTIVLNGNLDGEMVTDIRFGGVGQGEGATRNFLTRQIARIPLVFNVKVQAPFRQLITSAKGFYDPTILIEQNLPALLRVEAERDDVKKEGAMPVQPSESEPVR